METARRTIGRGDRIALIVVAVGATLIGAATLAGLIVQAVTIGTSASLQIDGFALGNATSPEFLTPFAAVTDARYESVTLTLADPPALVRWLHWATALCSGLITIGVAGSVAWLAWRTVTGRPFVRSATAAVLATAIIVLAAGLIGDVLHGITRAEVIDLLGAGSTAGDAGEGPYEGFVTVIFESTLASFGWGLGLAVVAQILQIGERMQKDTEGLI
ncbi:hypothetical protein LQF12_15330 [Ruania suaedae]|uniref:hypothetical protein n=1 Tax=Ruania suaedae TaxID=2897774 RepID=UPI001E4B47EF|nr:hypothetical protein [Ruania suaedae]UFU02836.1 hypothetical protein LQF12_15330 [Ruania suaedae]